MTGCGNGQKVDSEKEFSTNDISEIVISTTKRLADHTSMKYKPFIILSYNLPVTIFLQRQIKL